jgi:prolyl-tRNA editing enzyme YbaK/EbsC (Cys-tRNA(Pro) deacylase)
MTKVVQNAFAAAGKPLGKKNFNFRVAPEDVGSKLSGFQHNAVTPLGMETKIPIILDEKITELDFIWLGGGEVDVKWAISIDQFISSFKPIIGKVSQ